MNCNVRDYEKGIYLDDSLNNTIVDNTANSNSYGIFLDKSLNNNITNNTVKENNRYDIYVKTSVDAYCNNLVENNTGSGNRTIKFFNSNVNLQDEVLSELILCNADNSHINNVTIIGSDSLKNNGMLVLQTENSNFTNINSSNNYYGIYLEYSTNNNMINSTYL